MLEAKKKVYASLLEEIQDSEIGSRELALAELEMRIQTLLHRAFENSSLTLESIAEKMGTNTDRVLEVSEGNVSANLYEMARYLYCLGYKLDVNLYHVRDEDVNLDELKQLNKIPVPRPRLSKTPKLESKGE